MEDQTGLCFQCGGIKKIDDALTEKLSNGRWRVFGKCEKCKGKISKFIKAPPTISPSQTSGLPEKEETPLASDKSPERV